MDLATSLGLIGLEASGRAAFIAETYWSANAIIGQLGMAALRCMTTA